VRGRYRLEDIPTKRDREHRAPDFDLQPTLIRFDAAVLRATFFRHIHS